MPSFDVVNKVDLQEVDNAVNITKKTIAQRYDFKDSETEINLDRKQSQISISTENTMRLEAVKDTLAGNLVKRGVSPKALDYSEPEGTSKGGVRVTVSLKQGIDKEIGKKIVKRIKDLKLKVQAQIQDDQVRVTAKKIDDLQAVIALLKGEDLGIPMQYVNMKS
ncbi:MAG: YajQ family cyclic di-GMP-binding protein [Candidatus Hydrogenedentes bacterium]|nr:YajQ family cyclic di-GMP-binding protein [Candidatus Hydrogenedentota bacterium]